MECLVFIAACLIGLVSYLIVGRPILRFVRRVVPRGWLLNLLGLRKNR